MHITELLLYLVGVTVFGGDVASAFLGGVTGLTGGSTSLLIPTMYIYNTKIIHNNVIY